MAVSNRENGGLSLGRKVIIRWLCYSANLAQSIENMEGIGYSARSGHLEGDRVSPGRGRVDSVFERTRTSNHTLSHVTRLW